MNALQTQPRQAAQEIKGSFRAHNGMFRNDFGCLRDMTWRRSNRKQWYNDSRRRNIQRGNAPNMFRCLGLLGSKSLGETNSFTGFVCDCSVSRGKNGSDAYRSSQTTMITEQRTQWLHTTEWDRDTVNSHYTQFRIVWKSALEPLLALIFQNECFSSNKIRA